MAYADIQGLKQIKIMFVSINKVSYEFDSNYGPECIKVYAMPLQK